MVESNEAARVHGDNVATAGCPRLLDPELFENAQARWLDPFGESSWPRTRATSGAETATGAATEEAETTTGPTASAPYRTRTGLTRSRDSGSGSSGERRRSGAGSPS